MNTLVIDILRELDNDKFTYTLKVVDYIFCTTPVEPGEEVEVLRLLLSITKYLNLDWHPVFSVELVSLACEGKIPGTGGGEPIDKPVAIIHKGLCKKRAAFYKEKEPSIIDMADTIRPRLLTTT